MSTITYPNVVGLSTDEYTPVLILVKESYLALRTPPCNTLTLVKSALCCFAEGYRRLRYPSQCTHSGPTCAVGCGTQCYHIASFRYVLAFAITVRRATYSESAKPNIALRTFCCQSRTYRYGSSISESLLITTYMVLRETYIRLRRLLLST